MGDNVVPEAGYFCAAKGKSRVLIILEKDAKMPADRGGDTYTAWPSQSSIETVTPVLAKFAAAL